MNKYQYQVYINQKIQLKINYYFNGKKMYK